MATVGSREAAVERTGTYSQRAAKSPPDIRGTPNKNPCIHTLTLYPHPMQLEFTKMHGLGNDFVVIDATHAPFTLDAAQIRQIADRRLGVGCDQLLVVEPASHSDVDFNYRIFNADGGEVEQCGNGARCFARYVRAKGLTDKQALKVQTRSGVIGLTIEADGQVTVDMGIPEFEPSRIPFETNAQADRYAIRVNNETVEFGAVSMGNPHAVIEVADTDRAPLERLGPAVERHTRFPNRVNVGFMQIIDRNRIRLRVWERGVGETMACGSGACAAVVVGHNQGLLDENVSVELRGGDLVVSWTGQQRPVSMTGPASFVFEGKMTL